MDGETVGPSPLYAEFIERCRQAAEQDSVEARALRWRDVPFAERAETGIGLMRLADRALRSRPGGYQRPPLTRRIQPARRDWRWRGVEGPVEGEFREV